MSEEVGQDEEVRRQRQEYIGRSFWRAQHVSAALVVRKLTARGCNEITMQRVLDLSEGEMLARKIEGEGTLHALVGYDQDHRQEMGCAIVSLNCASHFYTA